MCVRMPVDNCMFTSQPTLPPRLSATYSEHSNNFDLTTGLNGVYLLRKHKKIAAYGMVLHLFMGGGHGK